MPSKQREAALQEQDVSVPLPSCRDLDMDPASLLLSTSFSEALDAHPEYRIGLRVDMPAMTAVA
jgi:hypothetical protein